MTCSDIPTDSTSNLSDDEEWYVRIAMHFATLLMVLRVYKNVIKR